MSQDPDEELIELAMCPGCKKPASEVKVFGWLFRCKNCDWDWGHPQFHKRQECYAALNVARARATQGEAK